MCRYSLFISLLPLLFSVPSVYGNEVKLDLDIKDVIKESVYQDIKQIEVDIDDVDKGSERLKKMEFKRTKSGATDAVALGMSPTWAEAYTKEDKERQGYPQLTVYERKGSRKKTGMAKELSDKIVKK